MTYAPPPLARWTIRLLFLLMAVGVPALAAFALAGRLAQVSWVAVAALVAYEALVVGLGLVAFPDYRRRYLQFVRQQHSLFTLKVVTRQGALALNLERLYAPVNVDAKFINQSPRPLLKMVPSHLRRGDHTLWDYFSAKELVGQNFVIVGEPGSGKTTLLKHLAWSLASGKPDLPPAIQSHLPVLLFLHEHVGAIRDNAYLPLPQAICEHLARRQAPAPPTGWFEAQLEAGNCLILLDGLSEIADLQLRQRVRVWVKACLVAYPRNRFVISSRLHEYRAAPLSDLLVLEIRPFGREQIESFVHQWQAARPGGPGPIFEYDLLEALEKAPALTALAGNPLGLTLLTNLRQSREAALPGRRVELYAALLALAPEGRRLPTAQRQRLLQRLAYHMMCNHQHEITAAEAVTVVAPLLLALEIKEPAEALLKKLASSTGVLVHEVHGQYSFAHLAFQEYLAAAHMVENQLHEALMAQADDAWWHETMRFYCAQTEASAVVAGILSEDQPSAARIILASECLEEALEARPVVWAQCAAATREALEGEDAERRQWVAEALLAARLRKLARQTGSGAPPTVLDETLITCAEYQLFLDEQRPESQFFQPDHWPGYRFPAGQSQRPALGVRSLDAVAFCDWLTEREPGEWTYRLPTVREVRTLVRSSEATTGFGYWTASAAGERGGRAHMVFELAWMDTFRPAAVSEEALMRAVQADLTGDLLQLQAADLSNDYDCNRKLSEALVLSRELDHDLGLAQDPGHSLESAQALARDLSATLGFDLGLDMGFEFELARDRERNLGYDLSLAREPDPGLDVESVQELTQARDRVSDRAPAHPRARLSTLDLTQTQARARTLSPKLERLSDPDSALARKLERILIHNLSLALDRDLDRDLALALDSDRALANALALTLNRAHRLKLARALDRVHELAQKPEHEADREWLDQIGKLSRDDDRLDHDRPLDLVQARDLALPLDLDLAVALEQARAHARDRDRAIRLARTLANARDLARDSGRRRNRALARIVFLLNALLIQPEARPLGGLLTADSPKAVAEAERQQLSGLYFDLYVDFVTLEGRLRGNLQPFEGIRLVRVHK